MKDKPLGFQIWIVITIFILIISITVSITITFSIKSSLDVEIDIWNMKIIGNLIRLVLSIIIFNVIIAKLIANRITEPIRYLEKKVKRIGGKKWSNNMYLDRKDEIGKLAYSIGKMQENLERMDKEEEFFIQSISHDLKTPIMIIKSYCQALTDGIYLNNSLKDTVEVIEDEAENLENKVKKLLYLNSLEYLLKKDVEKDYIEMRKLLECIVNRFLYKCEDIKIDIYGNENYIYGVEDKIIVAIENIIDNNLRYAKSYIKININEIQGYKNIDKQFVDISIENDGNKIDNDILENLFDKFYKGKKGSFGLGLYICKRIINYHDGYIWAENGETNVVFKILLPK